MRYAIAATFVLLLSACGAPTETQAPAEAASEVPPDARAGSSGAGYAEYPPFTLQTEAVVGQWSFDRSCGLYDLVIGADANVEYYDYSNDEQVVSYGGAWTAQPNNRVALTLRRLDAKGQVSGDPLTYNLDVASPVTDDLIGRFSRADGSQVIDIAARRCPQEDRD